VSWLPGKLPLSYVLTGKHNYYRQFKTTSRIRNRIWQRHCHAIVITDTFCSQRPMMIMMMLTMIHLSLLSPIHRADSRSATTADCPLLTVPGCCSWELASCDVLLLQQSTALLNRLNNNVHARLVPHCPPRRLVTHFQSPPIFRSYIFRLLAFRSVSEWVCRV